MGNQESTRTRAAAKDIMSAQILSVPDDLALPELVAFLTENQITGAPVVDRVGHFVGVVSVTDIAEAEVGNSSWEPEDAVAASDRRGLHVEKAGPQVRDIMTPAVYTVPEDTPVSELARAMISGRVHRLLVSRNGKIVGIVTSLDLLKLLCDPAPIEASARAASTTRQRRRRRAVATRRRGKASR